MASETEPSIVDVKHEIVQGIHEEALNDRVLIEDVTNQVDKARHKEAISETQQATNEDNADNDRDVDQGRCGVWSVGQSVADRATILAALDRLGPFILESYDCPLPELDLERGPFDSEDDRGCVAEGENGMTGLELDVTAEWLDDGHKSTTLSGDVRDLRLDDGRRSPESVQDLRELLWNDVIDEKDDGSPSEFASSESIEQVSDRIFEARGGEEPNAKSDRPQKRKRKETRSRSNFVKYRLNRRQRRYRNKRPKVQLKESAVPVTQAAV